MEATFKEMGGCGRFQVLFVCAVYSTGVPSFWSLIFMSFGNYNPGWTCRKESGLNSSTHQPQRDPAQTPSGIQNVTTLGGWSEGDRIPGSCEDLSGCVDMKFVGDSSTIVTEWGLVCDKAWIPSMIISLQMLGGLVGVCVSGVLGDRIGRKKVLYGNVFCLLIVNIVATLSTSWKIFAVVRFFMGLFLVGTIVVTKSYPMEFTDIRGRSYVGAIHDSTCCKIMFALCAWVFQDWRHIHWASAALGVLVFLPVFWVPESVRWLAARGKVQEAEAVVRKICKTNRRPVPHLGFLAEVAEKEVMEKQGMPKYTYLSILTGTFRTSTLVFCFLHFSLSLSLYSLSFGVKALSGNFYLNLLLVFSAPVLPFVLLVPIIAIKLGRKWGFLLTLSMTTLSSISVIVTYFTAPIHIQQTAITVLVIISLVFICLSWGLMNMLLVETYPTVIRSMATGMSLMAVRVASIIAPYAIPRDFDSIYITYTMVIALLLACMLLTAFLRETKNRPMLDVVVQVPERNVLANSHEKEDSHLNEQRQFDVSDEVTEDPQHNSSRLVVNGT